MNDATWKRIWIVPVVALAILLSVCYIILNFNDGANYRFYLEYLLNNFTDSFSGISGGAVVRTAGYAIGAVLYIACMFMWGIPVAKWLGGDEDSDLTRFCTAAAVGAGMLSLFYLLTGLCGFAGKEIIIALVILPFIISAISKRGRTEITGLLRTFTIKGRSPFWMLCACVVALYCVIGFVGSMSPPEDADALMYHLAVPKLYIEAGRIFYIPHMLQSNWPFATEMQYMAVMSFSGATGARMVNFIFIILASVAAAVLAKEIRPGSSGIAASAIFLSVPILQGHFFMSNIEPALCFYTIVAVIFAVRYSRNGCNVDLCAAAIISGFAAATKYTGAVYLVIVWSVIIVSSIKHRKTAQGIFLFPAIAVIPVLPWLIKSYVWTGNPVWPFFYSVFGGRNWSEIHARDYLFYLNNFFGDTGVSATIRLLSGIVTDTWNRNTGMVIIGIAPVALLNRKIIKSGAIPLFAIFAMIGVWGMTSPQSRFLVPAAGILSSLVAASPVIRYRSVKVLFIVAFTFHIALFAAASLRHVPYAVGGAKGTNPSESMNNLYEYVDRETPEDSRLLLLWDSRGYYSPREYVVGDALSQAYIDYVKYENTARLMGRLYEEGITHVVVSTRTISQAAQLDRMLRDKLELSPGDPTAIYYLAQHQRIAIEQGWWEKIYETPDGSYYLYRIDYSSFTGTREPETT